MKFIDWLYFKLFSRWFRITITITDPEQIKRIKEEFRIK